MSTEFLQFLNASEFKIILFFVKACTITDF